MKDEIIPVAIKGILGVSGAVGSAKIDLQTIQDVDLMLGIVAKCGGILVAIWTLISLTMTIRRQWKNRNSKSKGDTTHFNLLLAGLSFLLLSGCSALVPSEKRVSQSVQATEAIHSDVERTTERTMSVVPEMAIAVRQDSNVVAIPLGSSVSEVTKTTTRSSTGAGSRDTAAGSSASTIPLFVKIIGSGIGLIVLAIGLRWLWNTVKTTALGQGLAAADDLAARHIRKLRERAALATDASEQARLNLDIAELEAERGRLTKR